MFGALLEPSDARKGESYPLTSDIPWMTNTSRSGTVVNEEESLTLPAFFRGVDNICSHCAMIPLPVLNQTAPDSRERDRTHPVHRVLNREFNPEMTAFQGRRVTKFHSLLWGNGICEIERDRGGKTRWLWPLHPSTVNVNRIRGKLVYELHKEQGQTVTLDPRDVTHVPHLGPDGINGYGLIDMLARENVGSALALAEYVQNFYANNMQLGVVITSKDPMKKEAKESWINQLKEEHSGPANVYKALIMDGGDGKVHHVRQDNAAAQMVETMTINIGDAARWLNVPPAMLFELSRATFSNIVELGQWYERFSLGPWFVADEQEFTRKLFLPSEENTHFVEYVADALLRAQTSERYDAHAVALASGFKNIDEVRATENLNPLPDGKGQEFRVQMNTEEVGTTPDGKSPTSTPKRKNTIEQDEGDRSDRFQLGSGIVGAHQVAIDDVADRMDAIHHTAYARAEKAGKANAEWVKSFEESHAIRVRSALIPVVEALAGSLLATLPGPINTTEWAEMVGRVTQLSVDLNQVRGVGVALWCQIQEKYL